MKAICLESWGGYGTIGQEYLITGLLLGEGSLDYLIDDHGLMTLMSVESFTITDNTIPPNWFCKTYAPQDPQYSYKEAVFGYYELCFDEQHYPNLVEREPAAMQLYFQRKLETEKYLNEWAALSAQNTKEQSQKKYSVTISENQTIDLQRRSHTAEIWDHDRIIATVAQNYTHNTFDVEMYPPLHGPLLLDYLAFEQAMQRARIQLIMAK